MARASLLSSAVLRPVPTAAATTMLAEVPPDVAVAVSMAPAQGAREVAVADSRARPGAAVTVLLGDGRLLRPLREAYL